MKSRKRLQLTQLLNIHIPNGTRKKPFSHLKSPTHLIFVYLLDIGFTFFQTHKNYIKKVVWMKHLEIIGPRLLTIT
jgi:hypothetical protein